MDSNFGIITKVCKARGKERAAFGFLVTESGKSLFWHFSEIAEPFEPAVGQRVAYVVGAGKNGRKQAQQLKLVQPLAQGPTIEAVLSRYFE